MLFSSTHSPMIATAIAAPQPDPFNILDRVAVALLLLGALLPFIPPALSLVPAPHTVRPDFVLHQLSSFFGFAVVEMFGVLILWARGHMPRMSEDTLKSMLRWTRGLSPRSSRRRSAKSRNASASRRQRGSSLGDRSGSPA